MRILVVGAGATGGYFGALLARAGRDVTFLVRPGRAAVLRERGLRVTGVGGDLRIDPVLVTADAPQGPYDLVLLAVKATALDAALDDLAPAVGPGTAIVPFLNGMAHLDALDRRFGADAVLGGVVRIASTVDDDGDVVKLGSFADVAVGERSGADTGRIRDVHAALAGAGFDTAVAPDVVSAMWGKWVFIATVAATTCLGRGSVGEIVAVPGGADLGPAVLAEAAAVAAAAGHPVPDPALDATRATVTAAGSTLTASLYRDLAGGRATEVEHVLGDLAARGRATGVATPLLDLAVLALRVHERRLG